MVKDHNNIVRVGEKTLEESNLDAAKTLTKLYECAKRGPEHPSQDGNSKKRKLDENECMSKLIAITDNDPEKKGCDSKMLRSCNNLFLTFSFI